MLRVQNLRCVSKNLTNNVGFVIGLLSFQKFSGFTKVMNIYSIIPCPFYSIRKRCSTKRSLPRIDFEKVWELLSHLRRKLLKLSLAEQKHQPLYIVIAYNLVDFFTSLNPFFNVYLKNISTTKRYSILLPTLTCFKSY